MQNTKIYQVFESLSAKEIRRFRQFLGSPYFNKRQELEQLGAILGDAVGHKKALKKQDIFRILYPGEAYEDLRVRHAMSDLFKLLEQFLALEQYQKQEVNQLHFLLPSYRKRKLDKEFSQTLKKARKIQATKRLRNRKHYQDQYLIESELHNFLESKGDRAIVPNLEASMDALDKMYLINKLRYCCDIINYQNVIAGDYDLLLMDEIMEHVRKHNYDDVPAIKVYYQILITFNEFENETHFQVLKDLIEDHAHLFDKAEARTILNFAQNYSIRKINKGKIEFSTELFSLYQMALNMNLLLEKGLMSPWNYKNITAVALRLGEFDWVEEFLVQYKAHLDPAQRDNAYKYNLAKLHFAKKDYDKVLELLREVEYEDLFYSLDSRSMLLKTYYELNEFEPLFSLADSFKVYLRRKKNLSDNHRINYLNLIRFVKKATRVMPGDKERINQLTKEINEAVHVSDINWLREKISELK